MTHELKIQKQWADAKLAGEKPFEIRRNDRGFQKGDIVRYKVVDPKTGEPWKGPGFWEPEAGAFDVPNGFEPHPLERCDFVITYVREGADGLEKGYCVYADQPVPRRPVSADLGSGATPSNGDGEPLPPPAPLAESPRKETRTDEVSVALQKDLCKYYLPIGLGIKECRYLNTCDGRCGHWQITGVVGPCVLLNKDGAAGERRQ